MSANINRRRFIGISAAATGMALLPFGAAANSQKNTYVWRGFALGAQAQIILHHHDKHEADMLFRQINIETKRLENIFSLYKDDSEISALNRLGAIANPSREMVDLLRKTEKIWHESNGLFDPTVQPLWLSLSKFYAKNGQNQLQYPAELLKAEMPHIGFSHVRFNEERIAFSKSKMAITLNGIAQGYITDQIVNLLAKYGINQSLVNMGEYRAIGSQPDGTDWRIGVTGLSTDSKTDFSLEIADKALATSSAEGFTFDADGKHNHLLNPKTGLSASLYKHVTVVADTATSADAWATAFSLMSPEEIRETIDDKGDLSVSLLDQRGNWQRFEA